jgi:DnaK suppressor protein
MTDIATRNRDLKLILTTRRHEMQDDVQRRISDGRTDRRQEVGDDLERSDADFDGALDMALLQMRTETLTRIDEALARLDAGEYGWCFECAGEIAERRLRALPFAVRCQACEERREQALGHARHLDARHHGFSLFPEMARP